MNAAMQHLLMVSAIIEVLIAIPAGMILKRIGYSTWWALLVFVPIVALFGLWLVAFVKWPKDGQVERQ